jgi:hypothetical protein
MMAGEPDGPSVAPLRALQEAVIRHQDSGNSGSSNWELWLILPNGVPSCGHGKDFREAGK